MASAPQSRPTGTAGAKGLASAVHARVQEWITRLGRISGALVREMSGLGDRDARRPDGGQIDLARAWALMARATGFLRALQARVVAELMAKLAAMHPEQKRPDRPEPPADGPTGRPTREPTPSTERRKPLDHFIAGKPLAEVVAQICADLGEAAVLFGKTETAREIATIAAAVRELLGGPAEGWTPEPVARPAASPAQAAEPAAPQGAARPPRAPDSG